MSDRKCVVTHHAQLVFCIISSFLSHSLAPGVSKKLIHPDMRDTY